MNEDLRIIGIISDRDLDARFTIKELKKTIYECLQLGPMY